MKQKLAVITGADGGMGMEITRAVATAGYKVIMACRDPEIAEEKRQLIMRETGNIALEIVPVRLTAARWIPSSSTRWPALPRAA